MLVLVQLVHCDGSREQLVGNTSIRGERSRDGTAAAMAAHIGMEDDVWLELYHFYYVYSY